MKNLSWHSVERRQKCHCRNLDLFAIFLPRDLRSCSTNTKIALFFPGVASPIKRPTKFLTYSHSIGSYNTYYENVVVVEIL